MNKTKNVLLASSLALLGVTLASCAKNDVRNTEIPYESISSTKVVAKVGDISITEKELYNKLRYSSGTTVFNKALDNLLYGEALKEVKYEGQAKIDIDEEIATAVYGTNELTKLKLMKKDDLELSRKKFVDKMAQQGLVLTEDELVFDEITKKTENVSFSKLSEDTINHYKYTQAKKVAGKKYIESVADKEYIEKEDGKNQKNQYYIDDKKIEARYENNYRKYNTATGIILRFNNAADANRAIALATDGHGITKATVQADYVKLYNNYYNYEDEDLIASQIGVNENTIFKTNSEVSQLTQFHEEVKNLFVDKMEDGDGLLKPINIGDKYYLIYRQDVTFLTGEKEDIPYTLLTEKLGEEKVNEIKKELKADIIDEQAPNVSSTLYTEGLEDKDLKIYDPFIENNFAGSNLFYEYVSDFDNKYIFTTKDFKYTTQQFYSDLLNYNLDQSVVELVLNKFLYKNKKSYLEENEEKDIINNLNTELKEFNKGNKNLNKAYGETNYLFFQYGVTTKDEVITKLCATQIKNDYLVDFVNNNWSTTDHKINTEATKILEILRDSALEVIKDKKIFNLNLDHILISVDNDQDGNPDNLLEFVDSLNAEELKKFEEAVQKLSKAIAKEVTTINRPNTKEKLDYIVNAFNNNLNTCDGVSWSTYKTYHFTLKAEALGNIDQSSANNYVEEFKEYVENVFDTAVRNNLEIDKEKEKDGRLYFPDRLDEKGNVVSKVDTNNFEVNDLCKTEFGYHMVSLNSYKKDNTTLRFKFTKENDTSNDYSNIKVILDEKDKDNKDDDIYIITDIYNDNADKPSINQMLVYFVEKTNGEVTSINTSIKNSLSTLLDETITKFKSAGFQEFLLLKELGEITSDNLEGFNYNRYLEYLKNTNENYDKESYFYNNWYGDKFNGITK